MSTAWTPLSSKAQPCSGRRPEPALPPPTMPPNEPKGGAARAGAEASKTTPRADNNADKKTLRFIAPNLLHNPSTNTRCESSETTEGRGPYGSAFKYYVNFGGFYGDWRAKSILIFVYRVRRPLIPVPSPVALPPAGRRERMQAV